MKKMMITLILFAVAIFSARADTWTDPDTGYTWNYRIVGDGAEIYNCYGYTAISPNPTGILTIPKILGGKPVTRIGGMAFEECDIEGVIIPDGVTDIGYGAFYGCGSLTSVTIPDSVINIEDVAFFGTGLTNIVFGAGLKRIGEHIIDDYHWGWLYETHSAVGTFGCCFELTKVEIPDGVEVIGESAFASSGLTNVTIPDSVTTIGARAFEDTPFYDNHQDGLIVLGRVAYAMKGTCPAEVTIPDGVTSIGEYAFAFCSSLTSVTIPDSVTSIGGWAFEGTPFYDNHPDGLIVLGRVAYAMKGTCPAEVTIPDGVTSIGDYAFAYCSGLASVTIPNSVGRIGDYAFSSCSDLTRVTIPNSVTNIGDDAFKYCSGLTSVTIPDSVTSIGEDVFFFCDGLVSVTIPDSVTSIGAYAFRGCSGLTSVTIGNGVTSIGYEAFYACDMLTNIRIPGSVKHIWEEAFLGCTGLTNIIIGTGVTSIGHSAFCDCSSLTSVTIPDSVTSIGDAAFAYCSGLTSVTIPASVTSIGGGAFGDCYGLTSVTIPDSVTSIGGGAFGDCYGLMSVTIPDSVTSIGGSAFSNTPFYNNQPDGLVVFGKVVYKMKGTCPASVTIPDSVTSIGDDAFSGCSGLTSVTIPDSVTSIRDGAFSGCSGLTSVTIPSGVTSIGDGAFSGCSGLTSVTIPSGVTSIGSEMFYNCSGLTSVTIPDSVTSIRWAAFSGCSSLVNVTIPDSVTSFGEGVFYGCSGLTSVTIPDSVTSIGSSAFEDCNGLTSVTIPDSVTSIGDGVFRGCSSLTNATIGNGVTNIGEWAFEHCTILTNVTIGNGMTSIGWGCFHDCSGLTSVTIPASVTSIGEYAFSDCSGLTSVTIPDSVTSIGRYAFSDCSGLTSVTIPASVTSIGPSAFSGCSGLTNITLPFVGSRRGNSGTTDSLFGYIFGRSSYTGGTIAHQYYSGDYSMSYYIPTALKTVTITDETVLGNGAFSGCNGLASVAIPDSVTRIGDGAFSECRSLMNVTIPNSVTDIGEWAFYDCSSFTSVEIPNSVTNIGEQAFAECGGLTNLIIGSGVTRIGDGAFDMCQSLTRVVIPNGVTSIGTGAFFYCLGLTNVTIPNSVTNIDECAFSYCSGLKSILVDTANANYKSVNGQLLSKDGRTLIAGVNGDVTIPDGVTTIVAYAFEGCWGLTSVTIPDSVTNIGVNAFSGCSALECVNIASISAALRLGTAFPAGVKIQVDGIVFHTGGISRSEIWGADKIHVVMDTVNIPSGMSLLIEPGAVVKFMSGASLKMAANGICTARGVIFTHINDDTVGGDTLMDGDEVKPVMNKYNVDAAVVWDADTQFRYHPDPKVTLKGTISKSEVWHGYNVYCVTGNLSVASGATLTIMPGAVVKFATGLSLTVNSGATLNAIGTRAQPIVFTSIKDDESGGDTNGDGEKTYPWAGDWYQIRVKGTANFNYCHVFYNSSTENYGAVEAYGGTVTLDNSEIAHTKYECVNAHSSGNFTARNSVFRDSSLGFGYYGSGRVKAYNCVFSDLSVAVRQSGKTLTNCAFFRCLAFTDQSGDYSTYSHCVFYNPAGYGAQSYSKVGSNGNIWGDPMFVDAENGDFRIQKGSVCVNAGSAGSAPGYDYYGQPRSDGAPDIGLYEIQGGMSVNDLETVAANVPVASSTIGNTIAISYSVANVGKQAINGSWRDKISLVSADGGYSIDLGTVVQTAVLAVGATNTFTAAIAMPTDAEGTWRVVVSVNEERDVYEGKYTQNNTATSEETVEVSLPARAASDGFSGTATKGAPASAKFALDGAEPMVARINAPAGTVVYLGSGFMPSASSYSARAVVGADGGLIGIPAGVTSAYILVETTSSKGVAFTMTLESAALAVQSVTPATLPYTGTTGLVIDGANFAEGCTVAVERAASAFGTGEPPVLLSTVVSPTRMTAQIDCSRLTAGATYDVKVVGADGGTATLPSAVTVANVPAAPKLKATLDAPASVRRGRTLTVYIDYENIGNADLPAPIFELISEGQVFKIDGAAYTNSVKVMGLSSEAPVGTLRPGEPQRLGIPVTILAENVKWKLKSYHAAQAGAKTARFSLRELYNNNWVLYHDAGDDGTIARLRMSVGSTFADYYTNLGVWLDTAALQTVDYETIKRTFGYHCYDKAVAVQDGRAFQNAGGRAAAAALMSRTPCAEHEFVRGTELWKDIDTTNPMLEEYVVNGGIWKWCPKCADWALAVKSTDGELVVNERLSGKPVFVLCHGNANDINGGLDVKDEKWMREMAAELSAKGADVLGINWFHGAVQIKSNPGMIFGEGLFQIVDWLVGLPVKIAGILSGKDWELNLKGSSAFIPETAKNAISRLDKLGLDPAETTLIGHSHGGHVVANIATEWGKRANNKKNAKFARYVGLDTSTADNFVHAGNDMQPGGWMDKIKDCCERVEFYKSSWDMSLEAQDQVFGHYNFALVEKEKDFWETIALADEEFKRHGWSHQWFIKTIKDQGRYNNLGYGFEGWKTVRKFAGDDIVFPGEDGLSENIFACVIRENVMELLQCRKDDGYSGTWLYRETVLNSQEKNRDKWWRLGGNGWSSFWSLFAPFETKSFRNLKNAWTAAAECEILCSVPGEIVSGGSISVTVVNNADNLSINYDRLFKNTEDWKKELDRLHGTVTAWLVNLEGLNEYTGGTVDLKYINNLATTLAHVSDRSRYCVRIATTVSAFPLPGRNDVQPIELKLDFADDIFGADNLLGENGKKVLLVLSLGDLAGLEYAMYPSFDLYPKNNYIIQEMTAIPGKLFAVISKSASAKKSASFNSTRLLAATPTHQLSANALKPREVVQVKSDKNGNWSIALDCTESYTTADEDEIVFNRFELTDAGNEDGAPRFQNNNTICDVERVTVSGTLPQTTDADGNLVCEGKRYTVQLTVASGDNEDDVTTCVIDVRATEEEDPGEDEDAGGSNEPKSCDPNEMVGDEGIGEKRMVLPGQELTYTIYFENKSDAEAAAACVEVFNPLSDALDWESLTMLDVGYNNNVDNGLSGLHDGVSEKAMEGTNVSVRTEFKVVHYDEEGNPLDENALAERPNMEGVSARAEWYLRIIDPNGDSEGWPLDMTGGFLPPNDPETHCGEGYIRYKIRVRDDVRQNTVVTNSATIIFDHWDEDALETDPAWWNTVGRPDWIEVETNLVAGAKGTVTSKTDAKTGVTTLTAKPGNKNSLFAYWIGPEGEKAGFAATLKVKAATQGGKYTAVFTTKAACAKPSIDRSSAFAKGGATMFNSVVGVTASDRFVVPDECYPVKFTATGMPKGLKVNATSGAITGVPTKAGKFTATVTVTSVANAKKKVTVKIPMTIAKLPKWTYGTFTGIVTSGGAMDAFDYPYHYRDDPDTYSDIGSATMSIGASGKISLKVVQGGTNWTASASGFAATSDCEAELYNIRLTAKATVGKKTYTRPFTLMLERQSYYGDENGGPTAAIDSTIFDGRENWYGEIHLQRYFWRDSSEDTAMLAPYAGAYAYYTEDGEKLTLTVAANGVTKVAGALASGRKLSLSTRAVMSGDEPWVPAYAPFATVKVKSGKTTKTVKYGDFYCPVILIDYPSDPEPGSCFAYRNPGVRPDFEGGGSGTFAYSTAYGQAASNKVVTVTAKPSKDSVFAYWMRGAFVVGYSPNYSVRMAGDDVKDLTAVFKKKSEFKYATLEPWWTDAEGKDLDKVEVANIMKWSLFTGMKTTLRFCIDDDMRPVKFSATGLPKGMKLNALTGVLSGIPTAASSGTAKITVTCTANTKKKVTQSFKWQVRKLRTFAKGTYRGTLAIGFCEKSGQEWDDELEEYVDRWGATNSVEKTLTLTVGSNGKASGKVTSGGKTYVLSTSCYSSYSDESSFTDAYDPAGAGKKTWEDETFTAVGTIVCGSMKWPIRLTVREWGDMNPVATKATRATDVNPKGYGLWVLDTLMTIETYGTPTGEGARATDFWMEGLRRVK